MLKRVDEEAEALDFEKTSSPETSEDDEEYWYKFLRRQIEQKTGQTVQLSKIGLNAESRKSLESNPLRPKRFVSSSDGLLALIFMFIYQVNYGLLR